MVYCSECGKDITGWVENTLDDYESIPKDILCRECHKKDEQLNKGKDE